MFSGLKLYALLAAAVLLIGAVTGVYVAGRSAGSAACEQRWVKKETVRISAENAAIEERNLRIEAAQAANARRAGERTAIANSNQDKVEAFGHAQADRPDTDCDITDDDARSLSDIK